MGGSRWLRHNATGLGVLPDPTPHDAHCIPLFLGQQLPLQVPADLCAQAPIRKRRPGKDSPSQTHLSLMTHQKALDLLSACLPALLWQALHVLHHVQFAEKAFAAS